MSLGIHYIIIQTYHYQFTLFFIFLKGNQVNRYKFVKESPLIEIIGLFEMSRETETGVALYTRKVLIKSKTDNILPKWLRFIKGVVDSEDIPLNLSRELLQNSALITYVNFLHIKE